MTRRFEMTDVTSETGDTKDERIESVNPEKQAKVIIEKKELEISEEDLQEQEELEELWKIAGGPRRLTMEDYHAGAFGLYEDLDTEKEEANSDIVTDLTDEEYLFCMKMNDFKYEYSEVNGKKVLEMWTFSIPKFWKQVDGEFDPNIANKRDTLNKDCILVFKEFVKEKDLLNKDPECILHQYKLIFCKEYIEFVRKPGRIRTAKTGGIIQATMFCVDRIFLGEGHCVADAVSSCIRVSYRLWLTKRSKNIKSIRKFFKKPPVEDGNLHVKLLDSKDLLESVREELMMSKYLLIDLEGDQLGPNGSITLIQINNYTSKNCYLIDLLAIGDYALREKDPQIGWLRDILQYPRVIKFFWGGVSDTANLFASYEISVAGFIDLQVVELQYRERLISLTNGQQDPTKKHPLGLEAAYEFFSDKSLIRFKAGKAKHKTDFHIWSRRPISSQLLKYAAFDVAALRPIVHVFVNTLQLWKWGSWIGIISKSGMTTYPRHRTCYYCLVTLSIDCFSKTQQKSYGICKICTEESHLNEMENKEKTPKNYESLPKRQPSESRTEVDPSIGEVEMPNFNLITVQTDPKAHFYPRETVLQRLGFTPKDY